MRSVADAGIVLAKEQSFPFWLAERLLHQGFSLLLDEKIEECLALLQSGLDVFNMTGAKLSLCHFYSMFAQAHLSGGNTDEALRRIDEAAQTSATNGNIFCLAEIHRLRGEIQFARKLPDEAEACFQLSLDVARSQQAKSWGGSKKASTLPISSTQSNCSIHCESTDCRCLLVITESNLAVVGS